MIVLNPVVTTGVIGELVGVIVSILSVTCVIVTGFVAVTVTVSFDPVLLDVGLETVTEAPGFGLVLEIPKELRELELLRVLVPDFVGVGLNTPVVAVKDVFVPFVPLVFIGKQTGQHGRSASVGTGVGTRGPVYPELKQ